MTDTEKIEQKIFLRLKGVKDPQKHQKIAREINALAQTLIAAYKEKKNDKR